MFSWLFFKKNLSFVLFVLLSSLGLATIAHAMEGNAPNESFCSSKQMKKIEEWRKETVNVPYAYAQATEFYVENKYSEAVEWGMLAMGGGDPDAKNLLVHALCKYGEKLLKEKKFSEAVVCFERAKANNVPSYLQGSIMINLKEIGMHYYDTEQFYRAHKVLKSASKISVTGISIITSMAQFTTACMYYEGKGTSQNTFKALEWFRKANKNGHPKAQEKIDAILTAPSHLN